MFDGPDYPKPLSEDQFESWLEEGRSQPINYEYMLVVWDELDVSYKPVYLQDRSGLQGLSLFGKDVGRELVIAVYDLFSEGRISII